MFSSYHIEQGRCRIFLSLNSFIGQCCSGLVNNAPEFLKGGGGGQLVDFVESMGMSK